MISTTNSIISIQHSHSPRAKKEEREREREREREGGKGREVEENKMFIKNSAVSYYTAQIYVQLPSYLQDKQI